MTVMISNKNKYSTQIFTLLMLLTLAITLTACVEKEKTTDASPKDENEVKQKQNIDIDERFAELENEFDAQLGVYAIDTSSNETIGYRQEERFAYASTYKALATGVLLQRYFLEDLNEVITYTEDDLVPYSPVTEKHVDTGMTLLELAEAAVRHSDNTAGNLLYEAIDGPKGFEQALNKIGDNVTQADRFEPDLNVYTSGDTQDTSTPQALATSLQAFAVGEVLSADKRELFNDLLEGNATGDTLIRAGAPEDWVVGDKSGAASYGTRNDIAVVWPPNRDPIVIAVMSRYDTEDAEYDDALIAEAARIVFDAME